MNTFLISEEEETNAGMR